ncbi:hypothetical protein K438DRAFT_1975016 [Mycena galopus ATCC 62051]|nr:hypothetical protein K438DRAFT_1975016 [Mycena galopus ATCC 62051]
MDLELYHRHGQRVRCVSQGFTPPVGKALIAAEIIITPYAELTFYNVFAVNASAPFSGSLEGGLIATILLTYSDGTQDTLVTDSSWRAKIGIIPLGFEEPSFDDTTWAVATVVGSYGAGAWDTVVVTVPADPAPVFTLANAQVPQSATIIIATDNAYMLYANGVTIGSGSSWPTAQKYLINFASAPSEVVLAVLATNTVASPAGVALAMEVNMVPSG